MAIVSMVELACDNVFILTPSSDLTESTIAPNDIAIAVEAAKTFPGFNSPIELIALPIANMDIDRANSVLVPPPVKPESVLVATLIADKPNAIVIRPLPMPS